jgi:hypothetical protein
MYHSPFSYRISWQTTRGAHKVLPQTDFLPPAIISAPKYTSYRPRSFCCPEQENDPPSPARSTQKRPSGRLDGSQSHQRLVQPSLARVAPR